MVNDYFDSGLKSAKIVVLLSLALFVVMVGLSIVDVLHQTEATLKTTQETVTETRKRVVDLSQNASGVLIQLGLAADQWAQASQEQRVQAQATTKQVELFVRDGREMLYRINNETIPAINRAIEEGSKNLGAVTNEAAWLIRDTNARLDPLLESTTVVVNNAAESSAKLNAAMTDVQSALKHTDETMANVALTSEHVEVAVKQATKPARFMVSLAKTVWDQILKIYTAFK